MRRQIHFETFEDALKELKTFEGKPIQTIGAFGLWRKF